MEARNPKKRLRRQVPCASSSTGQNQNPNYLPSVPGFNQNHVDLIISSFLSLPDLPSLSSSLSIGGSFDRVLDQLFKASGDESGEDRLIDRGIQLASLLHESTIRGSLKRATLHNSNSWLLPPELTIKVFSMLDTKSLMQASACCTMFNKCAKEPLCYSHIDLTTEDGNVRSRVVRSMILNAGKELRSLKVGCPCESTKSLLTGSCLAPLSYQYENGVLGNLLRSLHLYNKNWLENKSLCSVLSVCSNLTDLKIVGLNIGSLDKVLDLLTRKCQHLFLEKENGPGITTFIVGSSFERNCPNITSLSLIGFDLSDKKAYILIKGLCKLKYVNLSRTSRMKGSFLRNMRHDCKDSLLETLILKDCPSLEEIKVCRFLDLLIVGHFRFIQHIDVSNDRGGLIYGGRRCNTPKFPLEELKEERPGLTFVADFRSPALSPVSSTSSSSESESESSSSSSSSSSSGDSSSSSESEEDDNDVF